mmetsp:Transcript_7374/g.20903  ORF Transcript_7374/g.20903 Transcript_7374/m.20903 type:complete len:87 (-) Transcript_7374:521-781(-)
MVFIFIIMIIIFFMILMQRKRRIMMKISFQSLILFLFLEEQGTGPFQLGSKATNLLFELDNLFLSIHNLLGHALKQTFLHGQYFTL